MTKKGLAAPAVLVALLAPSTVFAQAQYVAQGDSPQWLKDRRYNEGIGIREGDLELHPGDRRRGRLRLELVLSLGQERVREQRPHGAPPIPALVFRITPSLYLSTLGPQRARTMGPVEPPSVAFRAGVNATYREFIGRLEQPRRIPVRRTTSRSSATSAARPTRGSTSCPSARSARRSSRTTRASSCPTSATADPEPVVQPRRRGGRRRDRRAAGQWDARLALRLRLPRHALRGDRGSAVRQHRERGLHARALEVPASHGAHLRRVASVSSTTSTTTQALGPSASSTRRPCGRASA